MKKFFYVCIVSLLVTTFASTAVAEDKTVRCQRYADSAVAQQTANTSRNCGLTGPNWSADHAYHYNWCMAGQNSDISNLERQRMGRQFEMTSQAACAGHGPKEFSCELYSVGAVTSHVTNKFFGCGYSGGRWSADYNRHYNWCIVGDNKVRFSDGETLARKNALDKCLVCWNYASLAVWQNETNLSRKCGLEGPQWKSDFDYHYNWCVSGDNFKKFVPDERMKRIKALESCVP